MAERTRRSPVGHFSDMWLRASRGSRASRMERLEEKHRAAADATLKWLSLLREMEHNGETNESLYTRYFEAYLQAKQQEKRADLELFNAREGLSTAP